jgi:Ferritin-like domain
MNNDTDFALPELAAIDVKGVTRSAFLVRGALAAGAVYGAGMVTPFVGQAFAQGGDADILNFALTLEYLEAAFYTQAVQQTKGLSGDNLALAKELRDNETEHVAALKAALKGAGAKPVAAPKVDFAGAFASEATFLRFANIFEDTGVAAYNGAGPAIKDPKVLGAAGSIVQIEARHAALIRLARGKAPAPRAFDLSFDKAKVLKAVKPFIKA